MNHAKKTAGLVMLFFLFHSNLWARQYNTENIFLRVMSASVPLRAGPGGSYTELGRVGRGEVYRAIDRSPDGSWYCIQLTRGISGWVLAELVWPFELIEDYTASGSQSWLSKNILGPSRLATNQFVLSLSGGSIETDGLFLARIGYQPNRYYMVELNAGQSVGSSSSLVLCFTELALMLGPWRSLVPFAAVGVGGAMALPHRQADLFESGTYALATAGAGLLLSLPGSLMLRLDIRRVMMYSPNQTWSMLAFTAGGMIIF